MGFCVPLGSSTKSAAFDVGGEVVLCSDWDWGPVVLGFEGDTDCNGYEANTQLTPRRVES